MSFVFYDTETTGLDTSFDQILQFGAIKTDEEFNEIERFEIRCKLLPHVVPSPEALLVTGITVEQLTDSNLPSHYEMMIQIKNKLKDWTPSLFIGWNSLVFDEKLLRQAFYQNLNDPYLTNKNKNCRSDAMRIVQTSNLFVPGIINVPNNHLGKPAFRLDQIAPANGFTAAKAHDAIGDVEATIYMCKLVQENMPDQWSNMVRFAQKATVKSFIKDESVFSLTDFFFGRPSSHLVTMLGENPKNDSEFYVLDLNNDPNEFAVLNDSDLKKRLNATPKPIRIIKANSAPIINYEDEAPESFSERLPPQNITVSRADYLKNSPELRDRLVCVRHEMRTKYDLSSYVEEQIYDSFFEDAEMEIAETFHKASWAERADIVELFSDDRLKGLGLRLIHQEQPEVLAPQDRDNLDKILVDRLVGDNTPGAPWRTLPLALAEVDKLISSATESDAKHLKSIRSFLNTKLQNMQ